MLFRSHGKITTTEARARRLHLTTSVQDKDVVYALFEQIAPRYGNRPGGYTRITKTGPRKGDAAPMAVIELVEELQVAATTAPAKKAARKAAAQQDKVEALAREDEAPAASSTPDQDAEAPENASGDKGAEGPGDQAEGEDTKA